MAKVTKQWMADYIHTQPTQKVGNMIGRALVALMNRQTEEERNANTTIHLNNVGFAACDAKSGLLTAKSFLKNGHLRKWQVEKWTRPGKNGYPRICKYARQLNEIAEEKEQRTA